MTTTGRTTDKVGENPVKRVEKPALAERSVRWHRPRSSRLRARLPDAHATAAKSRSISPSTVRWKQTSSSSSSTAAIFCSVARPGVCAPLSRREDRRVRRAGGGCDLLLR